MAEPQATITDRRIQIAVNDPEHAPLVGFRATVTYAENRAEIQTDLDPPVPGRNGQNECFARLLKETGYALIKIAENPKAIQFSSGRANA